MTPDQTIDLLTFASAIDGREVGQTDVAAWHLIVGDLDFHDAHQALVEHYRNSRFKVMPADVLKRVRAAYAEVMPHSEACRGGGCQDCKWSWCNCGCHGAEGLGVKQPRGIVPTQARSIDNDHTRPAIGAGSNHRRELERGVAKLAGKWDGRPS